MLRFIVIGDTEFELDDADFIIQCDSCNEPIQVELGDDFMECPECCLNQFIEDCTILEHSKQ